MFQAGVNKEKVTTVYNGINPTVEAKPLDLSSYKAEGLVVITASQLTRIKGVNYLLDAFKQLKNKGLKFHYFCIGNGEEEDNLRMQSASLGLDKCVTFLGYQNNVPEWLAACDVFVLPSLEEFHSIAILEAMRAKKAIVATNIGGNPESLRNEQDALLVPSMNADALAEALERVLTSKELRDRLGGNAHAQFLKRFTVDVMMKNLAKEIISTKL